MRKIYLLFLIISFFSTTYAGDFDTLYVKIKRTGNVDINTLSSKITIYNTDNQFLYAKMDEQGFIFLKNSGLKFKALPNPAFALKALTMAYSESDMANWDKYPTFDLYNQMMLDFQADYPDLCKIDTIGFSVNGRVVLSAKISDNVDTDENEPEVFLTGQMHGDEVVAYVVFLRLINDLLNEYGTNSQITNIINNTEIYINPLSNPDGAFDGGNNTLNGAVRLNANNVDLNRSFPVPYGGNRDSSAWEPEVAMMVQYADNHDFVLSANSHSGAEVINYPWDRWTSSERVTADNDWWIFVSEHYANLVQTAGSADNYFKDVTSLGYTNGGDWYVVYGSRQDYMNFDKHCREVTLELSGDKALDAGLLPSRYNYNKQALLDFIEQAQYGIRGIITDACSGNPVKAKIEVLNHDVDNSFVYSSLPVGNYHRLIKAGTYNLMFTAPGYDTVYVNNVTVNDNQATSVNVQMSLNNQNLFTVSQQECTGLINISANSALSNVSFNFGDNTLFTSGSQQQHQYFNSGLYTIKMIYDYCGNTDTLVQNNTIEVNLLDAPIAENMYNCGSGELNLTAQANDGGNLTWYNKNMQEIASGTTYNTGNISQTDTFYVVESNPVLTGFAGILDTNQASGDFYNNNSRYLIFDAYSDFILKSVKVYAGSGGVRTFVLTDNNGQDIYQTNLYIGEGEHTAQLDWNIQQGLDYQISISSSNPDLYRSDTGVNYPYGIPNVMSIKNSSAGNDYYYFFYNWEVQYNSICRSNAKMVLAVINEDSPNANFSFQTNMNTVEFQNLTNEVNSYTWTFGDGTQSNDENPVHTYSDTGYFTVQLYAENACGNSTFTDTVYVGQINEINEINENKFVVFPNPAKETIHIKTEQKIDKIYLIDVYGKKIEFSNKNNINVSSLPKGNYVLQIISGQILVNKKIVII